MLTNPSFIGVNHSRSVDQPPSINVQPPSESSSDHTFTTSVPNLTVPVTHIPSGERRDSVPSEEKKHVQFASRPEFSRSISGDDQSTDTEIISPDTSRRRRHHYETNRGYEASDDTDTLPEEDPRSRAYDTASSSRRRERDERDRASGDSTPRGNRSRDRDRDRSRELPRDRDDRDRTRDQENRRGSRSQRERQRQDPEESDATIELEPRFDDKGRRKPDANSDPLASKLDEILAGKGASGKILGNFMEGLFGSEGRNGNSAGKEKRRRVSRDQE